MMGGLEVGNRVEKIEADAAAVVVLELVWKEFD